MRLRPSTEGNTTTTAPPAPCPRWAVARLTEFACGIPSISGLRERFVRWGSRGRRWGVGPDGGCRRVWRGGVGGLGRALRSPGPAPGLGTCSAGDEVGFEVVESADHLRTDLEHGAPDAGVFMLAGGSSLTRSSTASPPRRPSSIRVPRWSACGGEGVGGDVGAGDHDGQERTGHGDRGGGRKGSATSSVTWRPPCTGHARQGVTGQSIPRDRRSAHHRISMELTFGGRFGKLITFQRLILTESPLAS